MTQDTITTQGRARTVEMTLGKTTQGTVVFQEDPALPRDQRTFPVIYVQKHAAKTAKRVRVTIEFLDEQ